MITLYTNLFLTKVKVFKSEHLADPAERKSCNDFKAKELSQFNRQFLGAIFGNSVDLPPRR